MPGSRFHSPEIDSLTGVLIQLGPGDPSRIQEGLLGQDVREGVGGAGPGDHSDPGPRILARGNIFDAAIFELESVRGLGFDEQLGEIAPPAGRCGKDFPDDLLTEHGRQDMSQGQPPGN
jgi:hypothetical protein